MTLLESAIAGNNGFDISTDDFFRKDAFLFGESQSRIVVSVAEEKQDEFIKALATHEIDFSMLGEVTDSPLYIDGDEFGDVSYWKELYENAIGKEMSR